MNIGKSKPYAILVFGAPMSGKTFLAEHLSHAINAPFLNLTYLMREYRMTKKLAEELINQISRSKSTLIIEGLIDTEEERKEMREFLEKAGYQVSMIWVQTDLNTIKQRMRKKFRTLSEAKVALSKSLSKIEAPSEDEKTIVISGKHTPQTQCRNIINCLTDLQ